MKLGPNARLLEKTGSDAGHAAFNSLVMHEGGKWSSAMHGKTGSYSGSWVMCGECVLTELCQ